MKMRRVVEYVAAGMAVYMGMAACSAEDGESRRAATGGGGGLDSGTDSSDTSGASGGSGGSGVDGSLLDALTDPIPDAKADSNTSGSRLKANHYAGADGSRQFIGWHDSERGEDCAFVETVSDFRCIPQGYVAKTGYFLNPDCTGELYFTTTDYCGPFYAVELAGGKTCTAATIINSEPISKVYSLNPTTPSELYVSAGATCESQPLNSPTARYFTKGAEVPLTDFAAATIMTD